MCHTVCLFVAWVACAMALLLCARVCHSYLIPDKVSAVRWRDFINEAVEANGEALREFERDNLRVRHSPSQQ